ncbi:MAG TPA: oligogalacturonate lyase family protein [Pyrinomonadaceae bacterium]|jgi:oligogalacturonide lyase|nr:oligogalacturonate lyase family protein [Pyrinomonadaceae bacterium]
MRRFQISNFRLQLLFALLALASTAAAQEVPREWVDPDTGHRVVRLSEEPGSQSLYFHQNGYTPDGTKMIMTTPTGLSAVNLKTRAVEKVVEGRVSIIIVGKKTGQVYYTKFVRDDKGFSATVYATDLNTKQTREVVKLQPGFSVSTVNADETLLAGTFDEKLAKDIAEGRGPRFNGPPPAAAAPAQGGERPAGTPPPQGSSRGDEYPGKGQMMENRLSERRPLQLVTVSTRTGEVKTLLRGTDWYNHIQFSPTDPTLLLYCHEGPWHKVDRTWLIRTDGTPPVKVHPRTMNMEIGGHEWLGADGKWVWYDLQTPKSQVFWVAGYNVSTGERVWYNLQKPEWSVHYNSSPDGKLFAGDGGGPTSVAAPQNGQWIYLFRPEMVPDRTDGGLPDSKKLIQPGFFRAERMVNLAKHNYSLEPNVTFTPDMKWLVFRSNMFGPTHVFAVEIEKSNVSSK